MDYTITVSAKDEKEAKLIEAGLNDPELRAIVLLCALLKPLPPRMRTKALEFAEASLEDRPRKRTALRTARG